MSRNKERLGGVQQQDSNPPPAVMQENADTSGGFSFVVPTEFVELPSGGKFYPEGHPLHGHDTIEIRHMTAKEEDILTSRTLIKKGVALDRVLRNIIVNKRIELDSLIIGDKNAIIVAARVSGYGPMYETKVTCPNCAENQRYSFDIDEFKVYTGEEVENNEDVTDNGDGTFNTILPRLDLTVTFRLLTGRDEKIMLNGLQSDKKRKNEQSVTRQLKNMIVAVNGQESAKIINHLVDNIPSIDSRQIRTAYRAAAPTVDLTQYFECSECDYAQEMEVPLTADFFWPDR